MSADKEQSGPSPFGERIRQLRVEQKLLQKDVALRVGIDDTYLSKIENGRLPPPAQDVIAKLAAVLRVPSDELLLLSNREGEVLNFLLQQDPSRRAAARQFIQELAREERSRRENRPIRRLVSKDDAREIAERAEALLTKSKQEKFSVDPGPPVPVEVIAELVLGLRIDRVLRLGVSGKLLIDEKVLQLEAGDHERRQRFTIAHEIGHFLLHGASLDHRARAKGLRNRKREREANLFAAALLMPRESFKEQMRSCSGSLEECAAEMATRFNVSREAAAARMKDVSRRR